MTDVNRPLGKGIKTGGTVALVFLLTSLIAGIGSSANDAPLRNSPASGQARPAAKKGVFKVRYAAVKKPDYAKLQNTLKKEQVLEEIAASLNEAIELPSDVTLVITECGTVNAFYDPEKQEIQICLELLEHFSEAFAPDVKSQDELDAAVAGATMHTFYHELGHALIHVLDLPVTGKEEDAVDQLATLILADGSPEGEQAVMSAARMFLLEDQQNDTDLEKLPYWDEHSLDAQRFYNIICWLYGHDEKRYAGMVKSGALPQERAERCAGEFSQIEKSWSKLLGPHLKK